jgi:cysteinyl-tRNA synthetase
MFCDAFSSILGYDVTYVSNYTDVDDKIIKRAKELGISEKELTEGVIKEYRRSSMKSALATRYQPRPTVYMPQIIKYVDDLSKRRGLCGRWRRLSSRPQYP